MANLYIKKEAKYIIAYKASSTEDACTNCIFFEDRLCCIRESEIFITCNDIDAAKYLNTNTTLLYISNISLTIIYKLLL